jgi:hypothetical protein
LADLQLSIVLDVVELLQFADADLVHARNGSERLAFGHHMGVAGSFGRSGDWRRRVRAVMRSFARRGRFWILDLLLEAQDMLGEQIDLYVMLVDFSGKVEQLG